MKNQTPFYQGGLPAANEQPAGPPGLRGFVTCLALLSAAIGTPYVFEFIGPFLRDLIVNAYGNELIGLIMYWFSYVISAGLIFFTSQMGIWAGITSLIAFLAVRGGLIPALTSPF